MKKFGWFLAGTFIGAICVFAVQIYVRFRREIRAAGQRVASGGCLVETTSGPIEYATIGEGPPLLLVHGAGGGYDQGMMVARIFGDSFRVVTPSRFGYLGTPLPSDAAPAAQADAFAALLDALGIDKTPIVGVSAGGPSSLLFALRHPQRCSSVVLISAISHSYRRWITRYTRLLGLILRSELVSWILVAVLRPIFVSLFWMSPEVRAQMTPAQQEWLVDFYHTMLPMRLHYAGVMNDIRQVISLESYPLERITAPTLVIHAANDQVVLPEQGQHAARRIPGARLVELESGGHLLIGQHDRVQRVVSGFLSQHID